MSMRKIYDSLGFAPNELMIYDAANSPLSFFDLCIKLDCMSVVENRLVFALAHQYAINTTKEIEQVLEYIPRKDRIEYVCAIKDKIPGYFLYEAVRSLAPEHKLQFALSQSDKFSTLDDDQIILAKANLGKLNGAEEVSELFIDEDAKCSLLVEWENLKSSFQNDNAEQNEIIRTPSLK